ncbi:unnamed protein product [Amoebophrya sp. A120]|nr:unnamed protein product [Amoebophrya sp. A120]|eukprot:GSA120T00022120001.1
MNGLWVGEGTRESLRTNGFKSFETRRSRSANPTFWANGPRGSTDRPLASFCEKPLNRPLADHPRKPNGPLCHNKSSDYRTNASLSTYPYNWRRGKAGMWVPRQNKSYDAFMHPMEGIAGWDNSYTHQNTHFAPTNTQYGSFWFDRKLQPAPRVFNQTQPGGGWYPVSHGHRP